MSRAMRTMAVLWGAAAMLGGCGKGEGGAGTKTPKEAVANLSQSIEKADKALFLSTVYVGADDQEPADAVFGVWTSMVGLASDVEKAYGEDAGDEFRRGAPVLTDEELAKLEIQEEGDKVTVTPTREGEPLKLVKRNGGWFVDLTRDMPPAAKRKEMLQRSKDIVKALGEVRAKIGKPGMTREKIGAELLATMVKFGTPGEAGTQPAR